MLNHRLRIKQVGYPIFAKIIDFLLINLSVILISFVFSTEPLAAVFPFCLLFSVVFILTGEYTGLYRYLIKKLTPREFTRLLGTLVLAFIFIEFAHLIYFLLLPKGDSTGNFSELFPRGLWFYLIPLATTVVVRLIYFILFRKEKARIAIIGLTPAGLAAEKEILQEYAWSNLELSFYDDRDESRFGYLSHSPYRGTIDNLLEAARNSEVDEIYIALPMVAVERIRHFLDLLSDTTVDTYIIPDLCSYSTHTTEIRMIGNMQAVSILGSPFDGGRALVKRAEDIIVGTMIILLISPLMLLIAAGIKLTSRGPAIFKQTRYGLNGQSIMVWKFRSMRVMENDTEVIQATKNDPRVTRFGAFLRGTSLDELPQFINVLQGSMSIVGPRPHAIAHNERYRSLVDNYMIRHKVKPGITGLAQINGYRGETDTLDKMEKRVEYDIEYIMSWSLWLDLKIIWRTVFKGFSSENAY